MIANSSIGVSDARLRRIQEAKQILELLGFPTTQVNDRSALTLLALLALTADQSWQIASSPLMGITPIMDWCRDHYGSQYAPNTRETFRRQTMHQFVQAALVVANPNQPDRAVNSPHYVYQIEPSALKLLQTYGTSDWENALGIYKQAHKSLIERYAKQRMMRLIPVRMSDGVNISLYTGKHSQLIKQIIEEFAPRFAPGGQVVYVGDTGDKSAYFDSELLTRLDVSADFHGKMPDVIIYDSAKQWLLLIEAVTSHGPVNAKRHEELHALFAGAKAGLIFVTAFPTRRQFARYAPDISWETEVWIAESPDHLIHFDGTRFLGPYEGSSE